MLVLLLSLLAERDRLLAEHAAEVAGLRAQNAELARRVARLERLVSRNSGNSSMPPSADDLPGRKAPQDKPRRGTGKRKPGKQPGAPGSHLAWTEDPDQRVDLFPEGTCECGAALEDARDLGVAGSRQQVDIPLAAAQVVQHDVHEAACCCGRVHRADPPPGAGAAGTVTYGHNLQAWCVFLMVAHAVPVHRCAELIESLTGARPSPGFVHAMIIRAASAVAAANKLIRSLIILAHVVCADETPIRVGPGPKSRKRYLLVACTRLLTYYMLGDRSTETFAAFVFQDLDGVVVVHDRYQVYDKFPGLIHQLCCQHLLREPGRALARTGQPGTAGPHPRIEHRPRPGAARGPGPDRRAAGARVPARRHPRPVPGAEGGRSQAESLPGPAGMPA